MRGSARLFFLGTALSTAGVAFGGCGGTAIIDGRNDTGGGGTGAGGSTTSTSTSTTSSTTATNTGGGPVSTVCLDACEALDPCTGSTVEACANRCTASSANCVGEQEAFIACALDTQADLCVWPPFTCQQELFDFVSCRGANPVPGGNCSGNGTDCQCQIFDGQNHAYESVCDDVGIGGFCDCRADGDYIGTCWQEGPGECDPYSNCCSALIFITSPP